VIAALYAICVLPSRGRGPEDFVAIKKRVTQTKAQANAVMGHAMIGLHRSVRRIALDNGTEFHSYDEIEQQFKVKFYFATPYQSWERSDATGLRQNRPRPQHATEQKTWLQNSS
jgi:IS30 family transposase